MWEELGGKLDTAINSFSAYLKTLYFACTRQGVRIRFVVSLGKMTFAVLEL